MSGKELGNCTHQWTTNDEKNKQALSTLSVFFGLKKKDRQQQKEERSREEVRREEGNQTESKEFVEMDSLLKFLWFSLAPSFSSVLFLRVFLLSIVVFSFFFNPKKALSVESACLFFSSFVVHRWVQFPSSFPHVSTSPTVTRFFCGTFSQFPSPSDSRSSPFVFYSLPQP